MKFYAVKNGRQPGIYETWADCREQIYKYPGAVFKSFGERTDAENYLHAQAPERPINESLPFAYIDGSCSKERGLYGYGGFLYVAGKYHIIQGTGDNPKYKDERNIAGEIIGALQVVFLALKLGIKEINLYFDYAGIEQYAAGNWKAKTPLAKYYCYTLDLLSDDIKLNFIQVAGHTGIEGNELADYLAKEAVGAKLRKKDIKALAEFRSRTGSAMA